MDRKKKNLEEIVEEAETMEAQEAAVEEVVSEVEASEEDVPAKPKRRSRKKTSDNPVSDILEYSVAPLLKEISEIQEKYVTLNQQTETLMKNILEIQKNSVDALEKSKEPAFRKISSLQRVSLAGLAVTFILSAVTFLMTQSIRKEVFQFSLVSSASSKVAAEPAHSAPTEWLAKKPKTRR